MKEVAKNEGRNRRWLEHGASAGDDHLSTTKKRKKSLRKKGLAKSRKKLKTQSIIRQLSTIRHVKKPPERGNKNLTTPRELQTQKRVGEEKGKRKFRGNNSQLNRKKKPSRPSRDRGGIPSGTAEKNHSKNPRNDQNGENARI